MSEGKRNGRVHMKPKFEKPTKEVSERMKKVKSRDTGLEKAMEAMIGELGLEYEKYPKVYGKPDFRIKNKRILIFCDSSFWHGKREKEASGKAFKRNIEFWTWKINENRKRDRRTSRRLRREGWSVQRFWDADILKKPEKVKNRLRRMVDKKTEKKPTAIDLYCGAGGLTLGLKRAGFDVVAGLEIDPEIAKTYEANHPTVKLIKKDIREVKGEEILELTGLDGIDLIAGCPPCQGFCSLTNKYKRKDPRNDLMLEMARLIEEIKPKMVMMENVPGTMKRGKPILDKFVKRLKSIGYEINMEVLQMADYGVPQFRRRFVLLAGRGFKIDFPKKTHSKKGDAKKKLKPWLTLGDAIKNTGKPVTLSQAKESGSPQKYNWHVIRDLKEISIKRLKALEAGNGRASLPKDLRPKCHAKSDRGFVNVYGKLRWDQTPPTITSGCATPAMGRFGHPDEIRTISVREAAMIQTFPKSYIFRTDFISTATELVGNALPPKFAEKAAKACLNAFFLNRNLKYN